MTRRLELVGVTVGFGAGAPPALDGVDLVVAPGEMVGLIGPNGAGKSTALRVLAGLVKPTAGEGRLDGRPLAGYSRLALARSIALVAQAPEVPVGFLVREVVAMGRAPHLGLFGTFGPRDEEVVAGALAATATSGFAGRQVETLSGGESQRVVFARALAQEPAFLLLDEPTSHLDLRYQVELLRYARAQAATGVGVLLVIHDLNLAARSCDRLALLEAGRLVAVGSPAEVLVESTIERVFRAPVDVLPGERPVIVPRF
jgi:iron complex transport system ATP-binding protein